MTKWFGELDFRRGKTGESRRQKWEGKRRWKGGWPKAQVDAGRQSPHYGFEQPVVPWAREWENERAKRAERWERKSVRMSEWPKTSTGFTVVLAHSNWARALEDAKFRGSCCTCEVTWTIEYRWILCLGRDEANHNNNCHPSERKHTSGEWDCVRLREEGSDVHAAEISPAVFVVYSFLAVAQQRESRTKTTLTSFSPSHSP